MKDKFESEFERFVWGNLELNQMLVMYLIGIIDELRDNYPPREPIAWHGTKTQLVELHNRLYQDEKITMDAETFFSYYKYPGKTIDKRAYLQVLSKLYNDNEIDVKPSLNI